MDELGATAVVPVLAGEESTMERRPWMTDVTSGYLVRHMANMPAQGDRAPWINPQVHEKTKALLADLDDGTLRFS
jgi:hypothetical protein